MSSPAFIRDLPNGVCLSLKVQPRAPHNAIGDVMGGELKVKVSAPPVDSAANEALLDFLSETLQCPRRCLQLCRGHASRHKQIAVEGMNAATVLARLGVAVKS